MNDIWILPFSGFYKMAIYDQFLFMAADDRILGKELWKSDGTEAGTMLVKDIFEGKQGSEPNYLTNGDGVLFFCADDGIHGKELWMACTSDLSSP